jgi:hypothetical protein
MAMTTMKMDSPPNSMNKVSFTDDSKIHDGASTPTIMLEKAMIYIIRNMSSTGENFFHAITSDGITQQVWLECGEDNVSYCTMLIDHINMVRFYLTDLHTRIMNLPFGDRKGTPLALNGGAATFRAGSLHLSAVNKAIQMTDEVLEILASKKKVFST